MPSIIERGRNAWDAFMNRSPTTIYRDYYYGSASRPDRPMFTGQNARTIVTSVYNQISIDCAAIDLRHVRLDNEGRYADTINDSLNRVLTAEANVDQTGRAFIQDLVITLLDEGCAALVPVLTDKDPRETDSYKVIEARVGKVVQWRPYEVKVSVYNENKGKRQEIVADKRWTPIIQNPFYAVMNEPNSTVKRLIRVLNQLDRSNETNSSNKLDIIVQLPYQLKSTAKKKYAEERRKELTAQIAESEYGIGYMDSTEKIVQLNRSLENNLWTQAKELQQSLYNQLGFSESIFNGSADEATQLNYYNRTIEPIMSAIIEEIQRKWLSRTAVEQRQAIRFFRDPFKLVPVQQLAEIADKFTRNEIMTSNEVRSIIGMRPSSDPRADELINSNINQSDKDPRVQDGSNDRVQIQNEA